MFCYNNNLLLPLQLNLFVTNGQIYCYGTRTANKYRTHCVVQILRNLLFSTQVLKFGTLFLFQSLVRSLIRKCKSFFLRASTYSTSAFSPSINYNVVNENFCTLKRQINDDDDGGVKKKEHKFS